MNFKQIQVKTDFLNFLTVKIYRDDSGFSTAVEKNPAIGPGNRFLLLQALSILVLVAKTSFISASAIAAGTLRAQLVFLTD